MDHSKGIRDKTDEATIRFGNPKLASTMDYSTCERKTDPDTKRETIPIARIENIYNNF